MTHTCQCGADFTPDPAGRLRHQLIHGHRPAVLIPRDFWTEAMTELAAKRGAS
jgi:hypothetical protein